MAFTHPAQIPSTMMNPVHSLKIYRGFVSESYYDSPHKHERLYSSSSTRRQASTSSSKPKSSRRSSRRLPSTFTNESEGPDRDSRPWRHPLLHQSSDQRPFRRSFSSSSLKASSSVEESDEETLALVRGAKFRLFPQAAPRNIRVNTGIVRAELLEDEHSAWTSPTRS